MNFARQKPTAVGRTTAFVAPIGLFPSRFRFGFDLLEACPLFSISCELFLQPSPFVFITLWTLLPKNTEGGGGIAHSPF